MYYYFIITKDQNKGQASLGVARVKKKTITKTYYYQLVNSISSKYCDLVSGKSE